MESQSSVPDTVATIQPHELAGMVQCKSAKFLIVDSRTFCEYNTSHILNSVNVWSSKIRKKRLQQDSISVFDYLQQACQVALQKQCLNEIIVYDQSASCTSAVPADSFLYVLLHKLISAFDKVYLLKGGFLEFQSLYPELCEDSTQKVSPLTSLSQPCIPVAKSGPTRILPFLFLGSQLDANNKQLLMEHNIAYELNVSTSCPKPDFLQDSHFMRISVNDNFSEKLLPHFSDAFRFIDKVRGMGGRILVHCLAGISRSATVAIAFVMKHLNLHYDEAYRYVKNRRPTISPNINFVGQLLELDRQLMGDGLLYRSPTAPLYFDCDVDLSPVDILRSSSSSCVESRRQKIIHQRQTPTSPSTSLASLSLCSCLKSSGEYVSDRLPSSPVTPPMSPEFFCSYSVINKNNLTDFTAESISPKVLSPCDNKPSNFSSTNICEPKSFSTTASFDVKSSISPDSQPVCVLEISHQQGPVTYVGVHDSEPMVVRETQVLALPVDSFENETKKQETPRVVTAARTNQPPISEENNNILLSATPPIVPKNAAILPKKIDSKHLPRSYSSSETHLNTRRLLENQNISDLQSDVCARKSFSSDEVSKGFSGLNQPQSPIVFNRDIVPIPAELARCDSWSTSGLGSEISDWDSLQEDNHSVLAEDAQGPFDAVFADVFPGEDIPLRKLTGSSNLKDYELFDVKKRIKTNDARPTTKQMKRQHRNVYFTSSLNGTQSTTKESVTSSPTPRPVSLPGVTGTYITSLNTVDSNSNLDMGVEMDDNSDHDWQSEKDQEVYSFDPSSKIHRSTSVTEYPPVNPRTMGQNVRQMKEHHHPFQGSTKASKSSQDLLSRRLSKTGSDHQLSKLCVKRQSNRDNSDLTSPKVSCSSSSPLTSFYKTSNLAETTESIQDRKNSLDDQLKNWDSEFNKKIKNIESNVSSWDTMIDSDSKSLSIRDSISGFQLAQELVQSMEDLLENEINDIKRQASALSTKFGLHTTSTEPPPEETSVKKPSTADILSQPGIINPSLNRSTISFCPTLQQGIIRSGKLKNLHQQATPVSPSVQFEADASSFSKNRSSTYKKIDFQRAKSEPADEGLYRARSCPGLPQKKDDDSKETFIRHQKPLSVGSKEPNRYSCGALDSLQSMLPSFESCSDINKLKRFLVDSTSSNTSSTHSSFNRLLQVS